MDVLEARIVAVHRERRRARRRRLVAQLVVLHRAIECVQAKAVDPAVQPEAHHVLHRPDHLGVAPVEVGLLRVEGVQVPPARARVARPGRASEGRRPVVRRAVAVAPDVPVEMLPKPGVLDRRVARHQVHEQ